MVFSRSLHVTLIKGALGYAIQLSANANDVGGGATMFKCNLDPPEFDSNSDPDPDSHTRVSIRTIGLSCHHVYDILYPDNENPDQRLDTNV
ncbi:hypothetical protein K435DRAFT_853662 [Dendrothele bispora CBS 962.96]|uniref:Uncharacterized protein n=1 Tax=Dendrothele bispora (strain CBS 962.96) TaxID=1314807 RepID=A0A4S8MGA8_DENBC|nr:hypothetical protein K435DRAFT_853662 [Dendrothele bispora CBS 962.96]